VVIEPSRRNLWTGAVAAVVALAGVIAVLAAAPAGEPAELDPAALAQRMMSDAPAGLAQRYLPAGYAALEPREAALKVAADPRMSIDRSLARPDPRAGNAAEAGLAELLAATGDTGSGGWRTVAEVFEGLASEVSGWLAVIFPDAIGNLSGAPIPDRIDANRIRLAASVSASTAWPSPPRPWNEQLRQPRADLAALLDGHTQLIFFDPDANSGQGSWVELRGDLSTATRVGVLVPGGSAFIISENFARYSTRAQSFVTASDGELAMIVWAGAPFPSGWIQEASPAWATEAAPLLVDFINALHAELGAATPITLAGHSYGGAIVGVAETSHLDADQVMHVASAGSGYGVDSPSDYTRPCRTRYVMMAPGDPISYVQGIPEVTGMGHGVSPQELAGIQRLATGFLPDDPQALDDVGRTLGSQGIDGKRIGGVHAHSEVFIPHSDAWTNMFRVFTHDDPILLDDQPQPLTRCR
jgi:hypothetical protein